MRKARLHEPAVPVSVQPEKEVAHLVRENPAESGGEDVSVHVADFRCLGEIPVAVDRPGDLLDPESDPADLEVGLT